MSISTDEIIEVLARETSANIVSRSAEGVYTLQTKPTKWCGVELPGPTFQLYFNEETGILESSCVQRLMSEKFERIKQDMIDEEGYEAYLLLLEKNKHYPGITEMTFEQWKAQRAFFAKETKSAQEAWEKRQLKN